MTAPIQPIIIKGNETGLQPLLRAIEMRKAFQQQEREFQLKREEFELSKLQHQKTAELTDEQILESKQKRRKAELEIKEFEKKLDGRRLGTAAINEVSSIAAANDWNFATPEFQKAVWEKRAEVNDPYAQEVFDEWLASVRQEATAVSTVESQTAAIAEAEEQQDRLRDQEQRQLGTDVADTALDTGMSLGESAALLGQELPPGVDPNLRFGTPAQRQAATPGVLRPMTEQTAKANMLLGEMRTASALIEPLIKRTKGLDWLTQLAIRNPKGKAQQLVLNNTLSEDQQRLIQAGLQYASAWQYEVSGQQINNDEFARLMVQTFPQFGDEERTIQQKLVLQQSRIRSVEAIAGQGLGAGDAVVNALQEQLDGAIRYKWGNDIIMSIRAQLRQATEWRDTIRANTDMAILGQPPVFDAQGNRVNQNLTDATRTNWDAIIRGMTGDSTAFDIRQASPVRRP